MAEMIKNKETLQSSNPKNLNADNRKQGWEVKKLGEVLMKTELVDPAKNPDKEFTYLDVSSVNKETKEIECTTVLLGKDAPSRARKLVRKNDVIFATVRPTHSRVAFISEEYDGQVCSTGYFVLRGKENIDNRYLFYFLLTDEFNKQMEKLQKGASYPAVTDADVKSIFLRFPKSLPEQQRIVSILDEAFAAIAKAKAKAEQNLQNAKELFESYLQGVFERGKSSESRFSGLKDAQDWKGDKKKILQSSNQANPDSDNSDGWEVKKLGEIAEIEYGYTDKAKIEGDLRYIRITDIDNEGLLSDKEKVYVNSSEDSKKFILSNNDLLMARTGATFGKVLLYEKLEPSIFASYLIRIKFNSNIENKFYWYFSKSPNYWKQANLLSSGAAQPQFNGNALKQIVFSFPKSLKNQQTIVRQLDALRAQTQQLAAVYQQKLAALDELKKSILQKAFAGELRSPEGAPFTNDGYSPSDKEPSIKSPEGAPFANDGYIAHRIKNHQ